MRRADRIQHITVTGLICHRHNVSASSSSFCFGGRRPAGIGWSYLRSRSRPTSPEDISFTADQLLRLILVCQVEEIVNSIHPCERKHAIPLQAGRFARACRYTAINPASRSAPVRSIASWPRGSVGCMPWYRSKRQNRPASSSPGRPEPPNSAGLKLPVVFKDRNNFTHQICPPSSMLLSPLNTGLVLVTATTSSPIALSS